jgi:hypothetical protein
MKEYQERVLVEQKELSKKINSLTTFITDIDKVVFFSDNDFVLLRRQLEVMLEYDRILVMRLRSYLNVNSVIKETSED